MHSDYPTTYNYNYNSQAYASPSPAYTTSNSYTQSSFNSSYTNYYLNANSYSNQYPSYNYNYNSTPSNQSVTNSSTYSPDFYLKPDSSYSTSSPCNYSINYNDSAYQSCNSSSNQSIPLSRSAKRKSPEPELNPVKIEPVHSHAMNSYCNQHDEYDESDDDDDDFIVKRQKVERLLNPSDPNNLICGICNCEFDSWAKCLMHKHKVHDGLKGTQCPICSKLN
jgi:hypothetical protein